MKTAINLKLLQSQESVRLAVDAIESSGGILWTARLAVGGKSCAPRPVTRLEA
jgi:hypothetical protein